MGKKVFMSRSGKIKQASPGADKSVSMNNPKVNLADTEVRLEHVNTKLLAQVNELEDQLAAELEQAQKHHNIVEALREDLLKAADAKQAAEKEAEELKAKLAKAEEAAKKPARKPRTKKAAVKKAVAKKPADTDE